MSGWDAYKREKMAEDELRARHQAGGAPTADLVAEGRRWRRVAGPRPWRPKHDGDVLIGRLLARSTKPGDGGTNYGVATLESLEGPVTITGVVITGLLDAAGTLEEGTLLRVVYRGEEVSTAGRKYKVYELYVEV